MTSVALTGASGFVGRHVLDLLEQRGHRVRALVRSPDQIPTSSRARPVIGRLDQPEALEALVEGADCVVHLAGATGGIDYVDFARVNVDGTRLLLNACLQRNAPVRFIHLSSLAAREPGLSHYSASKRAGEDCVTASKLNWVVLRPPAVYGPDDPALAPLWQALARGWLIRTGPRQARFSLLHVDDLAAAIVALVDTPGAAQGQVLELHDGHSGGYGWDDLREIAASARGGPVRTLGIPPVVLKSLGLFNLSLARLTRRRPPPLVPGKVRELVHHDWVCDNSALPGCEGWRPTMTLTSALAQLPGWRRTG